MLAVKGPWSESDPALIPCVTLSTPSTHPGVASALWPELILCLPTQFTSALGFSSSGVQPSSAMTPDMTSGKFLHPSGLSFPVCSEYWVQNHSLVPFTSTPASSLSLLLPSLSLPLSFCQGDTMSTSAAPHGGHSSASPSLSAAPSCNHLCHTLEGMVERKQAQVRGWLDNTTCSDQDLLPLYPPPILPLLSLIPL